MNKRADEAVVESFFGIHLSAEDRLVLDAVHKQVWGEYINRRNRRIAARFLRSCEASDEQPAEAEPIALELPVPSE